MGKTATAFADEGLRPEFTPDAFRRVRAVLAARGMTIAALAEACDVTREHLRLGLSGARPISQILAVCVRRELGDAGWFYVLGMRATLG